MNELEYKFYLGLKKHRANKTPFQIYLEQALTSFKLDGAEEMSRTK